MAAITAAFVTQPVFGSVIDLDHQLIFTENSSSSLSATYDGATLTPTFVSTDEWTLQTNVRSLFVVVFPQWEEPGSASSINVFQLSGSTASLLSIATRVAVLSSGMALLLSLSARIARMAFPLMSPLMISERRQIAQRFRSEGEGEAAALLDKKNVA
jgi:hypothetical protein